MDRPTLEVAGIFRRYGDAYRLEVGRSLSTAQRRVMAAIEQCRTAALGGHVEQCDACARQRIAYHSCANRHGPKCQSLARATWVEQRTAEVLNCEYFHVVFTVPAAIAAIALQNKAVVYRLLFRATADTLRTIAADPRHLGAEIGFFAVLHVSILASRVHTRRLEEAMTPFRVPFFAGLTLLSGAGVALAQSGPAVATLVKTEGVVYLNDQPVAEGAAPIALGEVARIRTDAGRAMLSLKRGGTLALADHASVRVWANGVYNFNKIELLAGSAIVVSAESSPLVACGIDVKLSSAGVFRFDVQTPEPVDGSARCGFRVYEGAGSTQGASVTYVLRAGQRMTLNRRAGDMIPVMSFSPAELDEFDRWSRQQAAASVH